MSLPEASLLHPASVAVIGASRQPGSVGHATLANILAGGFAGEVFAVNPHPLSVAGATWVAATPALPRAPDLAVIACPAAGVVQVLGELGGIGTRAAVVLSQGFEAPARRAALKAAAEAAGVRVIGPNSLGLMIPGVSLNASFAPRTARAGRLAFLSQSGALVTAMLDWAEARGVGFSGVVSVGDMADTDFADLIDLYAADSGTDAILLYVEGVRAAARFLSAARATTLVKPIVAIKAGRTAGAEGAALSHTGAITGSYDVHAAAFRRAGIVMVDTMTDLIDAAQVLCRYRPGAGNRVAIVTNGGGAGVLASDALPSAGAALARLSPETIARLDSVLPTGWSRANPVDIVGDARANRMEAAVRAVLGDSGVDAVIAIHCPTAVETGAAMAAATVRAAADTPKPVLASWLGPADAEAARGAFDAAGIAVFDTVDDAVRAYGYLRRSAAGLAAALRAPPRLSIPDHDRTAAQAIVTAARCERRTWLHASEARAILAAYGVPMVASRIAATPGEVLAACDAITAPYVVKLVSPDLPHKSDVGGVATDLVDADAAVAAARAMEGRIASEHPHARILGFEVQPMVREPGGVELLVGVADDAVFGPVMVVGAGGKAVEVLRDRAFELPPLDDDLATAMIARTRISALLAGYRDVPPGDVDGVVRVLEAISTLLADLPDIAELEVNPLLVGHTRVTALDVRMRVAAPGVRRAVAIRPMPTEWSADLLTRSGLSLHVRPVRPDDEPLLAAFFDRVSEEDLRFRFLSGMRHVGRDRLVAMTQIDYARTMHFLAFAGGRLIASALIACDPDRRRAEVAVSVDAAYKGRGVSWTLMQHVIAYARAEGIETLESVESVDNRSALKLEREMGFETVSLEGTEQVVRRRVSG